MRIFLTGAAGFVGSAILKELLAAGIQVLGLVRSENAAAKLQETGADVLFGDVNDADILREGASSCDAVIHTAFNHDFSQFKASCEADRRVIEVLGDALAGTKKPLVITSGIGLLRYDRMATEDDPLTAGSNVIARGASEEAAAAVAAKGVNVYIVRLPPTVHGPADHGFMSVIIALAREKGRSAYILEGQNRWPAVHVLDAAKIYRLIVEKQPVQKVYHAVAEEGIDFKTIAETIAKGLELPAVSLTADEAEKHFSWFFHFAAMDCAASGEKTSRTLDWHNDEVGLINDLEESYFKPDLRHTSRRN